MGDSKITVELAGLMGVLNQTFVADFIRELREEGLSDEQIAKEIHDLLSAAHPDLLAMLLKVKFKIEGTTVKAFVPKDCGNCKRE